MDGFHKTGWAFQSEEMARLRNRGRLFHLHPKHGSPHVSGQDLFGEVIIPEAVHTELLLIDARKGRRAALAEGVPVIGLLGVILLATKKGFIPSVREILLRLHSEAGFSLSGGLTSDALRSLGA
jgi:predicted nucleic acid-binding protein